MKPAVEINRGAAATFSAFPFGEGGSAHGALRKTQTILCALTEEAAAVISHLSEMKPAAGGSIPRRAFLSPVI